MPKGKGTYGTKKGRTPKEMKTKDLDTLLENEYAYEPPIQLLPNKRL